MDYWKYLKIGAFTYFLFLYGCSGPEKKFEKAVRKAEKMGAKEYSEGFHLTGYKDEDGKEFRSMSSLEKYCLENDTNLIQVELVKDGKLVTDGYIVLLENELGTAKSGTKLKKRGDVFGDFYKGKNVSIGIFRKGEPLKLYEREFERPAPYRLEHIIE
ncbi:hypothetical protein GF336_03280 [Candidatus Woesearchaeota archaeon]|nr:hypothetical protein [Candidatus Woesearchaeota archaeon]